MADLLSVILSSLHQVFFLGPHCQARCSGRPLPQDQGKLGLIASHLAQQQGPLSTFLLLPLICPPSRTTWTLPATFMIFIYNCQVPVSHLFLDRRVQEGLLTNPYLCVTSKGLTHLPRGQTAVSPAAFNQPWMLPLKWPLHTSLLQARQTPGFPNIYTDYG